MEVESLAASTAAGGPPKGDSGGTVQQHSTRSLHFAILISLPVSLRTSAVVCCCVYGGCDGDVGDGSSSSGWFSLRTLLSSSSATTSSSSSTSSASPPVTAGAGRPSRGRYTTDLTAATDADGDFDADEAAFHRAIQASLHTQPEDAGQDDDVEVVDLEEAQLRRALALSMADIATTSSTGGSSNSSGG